MRKRMMLTVLATAVGLMAGNVAFAADNELDRGDRRFLQRAAQAGQFEIEASKLATQRAVTPEIKEFAEMMITDHTAVDQELKTLAQQKGVELPSDLRWRQSRALKRLEGREDVEEFEEDYVDNVAVDAHQDAVELFEDAADDAEDPDVKAFASKHLPTLQKHLEQGKALQEKMEADEDAGGRDAESGRRAAPPAGLNEEVPGAAKTGGGAGATTEGGAATGSAPASEAQPSPGTPGTSGGTPQPAPEPSGTASEAMKSAPQPQGAAGATTAQPSSGTTQGAPDSASQAGGNGSTSGSAQPTGQQPAASGAATSGGAVNGAKSQAGGAAGATPVTGGTAR